MQYAIQTRDYNNDYLWSWEARGRDNPLAQVSLELLRLIQDGEKGVAVMYKNGTFHVIFSAIDTLGSEPIGKDFSGASIRLNLVFADLSQEQAKGLVRYYIANRANPGIEFKGIVTWDTNSWTINENVLFEAFERIPSVPISGKKLICQGGNEKPADWFDYDMSDETEGAKLVMQGDILKFAADPVPKSSPEVVPQTKDTGKKVWFAFLYYIIILVFVFLVVGVGWLLYNRVIMMADNASLLTKCENLEKERDDAKKEANTAKEESRIAQEAKKIAEKERDEAKTVAEDNSSNAGQISELKEKLSNTQNLLDQAYKKERDEAANVASQNKSNADQINELREELKKYQDIFTTLINLQEGEDTSINFSDLKYGFKIDPKSNISKEKKVIRLSRMKLVNTKNNSVPK